MSCGAFHGLNQSTLNLKTEVYAQSQVRAVYCPCRTKGGCGGGDFAGRTSSTTGLGQSTLQVRHKLMYYSWTLHLQVTLQWNYAKMI